MFINTRALPICLLGLSLLGIGCEKSAIKPYGDNIAVKPCWFQTQPDWPDAECGILRVPEDYTEPQGRQIELPFIRLKATEPDSDAYPLVVAGGGGPGGALMIADTDWYTFDSYVWINWYHSTIEAGRDLILIDNRGVGSSVPRLDCHELETTFVSSLNSKLERDAITGLVRQAFSDCRKRLVAQGIDLSQYHVTNAARDLEQLRIGLGVEHLNLYGVSYGSRVALDFERLYPQSARTLILDGLYPHTIKTYEQEPQRNFAAIMRVIEKCRQDNRCFSQFGDDLARRFENFLEQLNAHPARVTITSPVDYQPVEVVVTPQVFFDSLYMALYDGTVIARIPMYLNAIMEGNTDYLAEMVREYYVKEATVYSVDEGAYASYSCYDEVPYVDFAAAREELGKYPWQHYSNELIFDIAEAMCEVWDVPPGPAELKTTYAIDTPVLVYSGELDPVTPAELSIPVMDSARTAWANVWSNASHGVMYHATCADWTAEAFLRDPESNPFIYECAAGESRFIFRFE